MDELFDKLAKDTAAGISRRQAFSRFGLGVFVAALAAVGFKKVSADSCIPKCCTELCKSFNTPGKDRGQCISECQQGDGVLAAACAQQCAE
jgi:hypothetical protein